jgi:hypothetical protein
VSGFGIFGSPILLRKLSAKTYTTVTNMSVLIGFFIKGWSTKMPFFYIGYAICCAGVNGSNTHAVKAMAGALAVKDGYGRGEYSGWVQNLRAISTALATVAYGVWCVAHCPTCRNHGAFWPPPGRAYTLACAQVRLVRGQWLLDWQRVVAVRCAWGLAAAALAAGHACLVVRGARIGMNLCYTADANVFAMQYHFAPCACVLTSFFLARSRCCARLRDSAAGPGYRQRSTLLGVRAQ